MECAALSVLLFAYFISLCFSHFGLALSKVELGSLFVMADHVSDLWTEQAGNVDVTLTARDLSLCRKCL